MHQQLLLSLWLPQNNSPPVLHNESHFTLTSPDLQPQQIIKSGSNSYSDHKGLDALPMPDSFDKSAVVESAMTPMKDMFKLSDLTTLSSDVLFQSLSQSPLHSSKPTIEPSTCAPPSATSNSSCDQTSEVPCNSGQSNSEPSIDQLSTPNASSRDVSSDVSSFDTSASNFQPDKFDLSSTISTPFGLPSHPHSSSQNLQPATTSKTSDSSYPSSSQSSASTVPESDLSYSTAASSYSEPPSLSALPTDSQNLVSEPPVTQPLPPLDTTTKNDESSSVHSFSTSDPQTSEPAFNPPPLSPDPPSSEPCTTDLSSVPPFPSFEPVPSVASPDDSPSELPPIAFSDSPPHSSNTVKNSAFEQMNVPSTSEAVEYIPVPPAPLEAAIDPATLNVLGEATLKSLGMAGMSPVGLMQQLIEFVHVSGGLPWWGAIAAVTVTMRVLLFPVIVVAQRNAAKLSNVTPQMQVLQMKITEAREAGDELQVARYTHELMSFMKQNDVNPLKNMVVPLAQAPIFISMFVGLRRCASLPVASFMTGGMLWFPDLTVADPYYALPILTSVTMYLTIQLGTEVGRLSSMGDNAKLMMTVMRLMPVIFFPFMINFPSAVLCYWLSTNLVSLGQAGLLRIPVFREFCNIPQIINHHPDTLPITKKQNSKSTIETVKDSWRNMKVANQVQDRHRYDEVRFAKAGTGPVVRTFKVDPTKGGKKTSQSPLKIKATVKS